MSLTAWNLYAISRVHGLVLMYLETKSGAECPLADVTLQVARQGLYSGSGPRLSASP